MRTTPRFAHAVAVEVDAREHRVPEAIGRVPGSRSVEELDRDRLRGDERTPRHQPHLAPARHGWSTGQDVGPAIAVAIAGRGDRPTFVFVGDVARVHAGGQVVSRTVHDEHGAAIGVSVRVLIGGADSEVRDVVARDVTELGDRRTERGVRRNLRGVRIATVELRWRHADREVLP
jgi:hypothetical protein